MTLPDEDLALLVDRYLDGELSIEERNALSTDKALAQRFIAELRFQGCVGGLLRQSGSELLDHVEDALALGKSTVLADQVLARIPSRRYRKKQQKTNAGWWVSIASSVLAASIIVLVMLNINVSSGVIVSIADGTSRADQNMDLKFGSLLEMETNQEAHVAFKDGTHMELGATSAMRVSGIDRQGARVALEHGSISAVVSKQPSGSHFQVATKEALLTVIGTKFTATKMPWGTRVEVTEGRVLTKRARDGKEVEVSAGNRIDVGPGNMVLQPIRPPIPTNALTLEPIADSIVVGGKYSNVNRGTRSQHVITNPLNKRDDPHEYYLTFNLAELKDLKSEPSHAELSLHLFMLKHPGMKLRLARVEKTWIETSINWNNRPPRGELVAHWTPDQKDSAIDLTNIVQQAFHDHASILSFCLYMDESENADECVGFYTREAAPLLRPLLEIEE